MRRARSSMDIARHSLGSDAGEALRKVSFCLDQLENGQFLRDLKWTDEIAPRLTLEELVGALVNAEDALTDTVRDADREESA